MDIKQAYRLYKEAGISAPEIGWAGVGAAGGGLAAWQVSKMLRPDAKRSDRIMHILAGAGIGAVGSQVALQNMAGDNEGHSMSQVMRRDANIMRASPEERAKLYTAKERAQQADDRLSRNWWGRMTGDWTNNLWGTLARVGSATAGGTVIGAATTGGIGTPIGGGIGFGAGLVGNTAWNDHKDHTAQLNYRNMFARYFQQ